MDNFEVRIEKLEPMRMAVAHGFGESPESEAWGNILAFLKAQGKLADLGSLRFFGYNNPNPSPGSPNYGYDQWVTVEHDTEPTDDVKMLDFPGGSYAVTSFTGLSKIGDVWGQLVRWHEDSGYKKPPNYYQCLEEITNIGVFISPEGQLDETEQTMEKPDFTLYLPIAE